MSADKEPVIQCHLSAEPQQSIVDGVWVQFTLTNQSLGSIKVLPWYTPLEGYLTHLFNIEDEQGKQLQYQGPMVKRMAPQIMDYITLQPGESVKAKLDLQAAYQFKVGTYRISLQNKQIQVIVNNEHSTTPLCTDKTLIIDVNRQ